MNKSILLTDEQLDDIRITYIAKRNNILASLEEAKGTVIRLTKELTNVDGILSKAITDGTPIVSVVSANTPSKEPIPINGYNEEWKWQQKIEYVATRKGLPISTKEVTDTLLALDSKLKERGAKKVKLDVSGYLSDMVRNKKTWRKVGDKLRSGLYEPIKKEVAETTSLSG